METIFWKKNISLYLLIIAAALLIAIPILIKGRLSNLRNTEAEEYDTLIIVTPHNEPVRYEFERAFSKWYLAKKRRNVKIDWRILGGTSEIAKYLDSEFKSAKKEGRAGINIDIFFGGGSYDHKRQAEAGNLQPAGIKAKHSQWLDEQILPETFCGEILRDTNDLWYGCCLSMFGICFNEDKIKELNITNYPKSWADLTDRNFFKAIALADPSKSGSMNKIFEIIIQKAMQDYLKGKNISFDAAQKEELNRAWKYALFLLKRIAANARYFSDSASQVVLDVAQGNAAAGMCIDFYGRYESEFIMVREKSNRLKFVAPEQSTSVSADPVSILKGAPHLETAKEFVEFLLSKEGNFLWNAKTGVEGGTEKFALRRLPIRKDLYREPYLSKMTDADVMPYEKNADFIYMAEWTGDLFKAIQLVIKAMCIVPHRELREAFFECYSKENAQPNSIVFKILYELPAELEWQTLKWQTINKLKDPKDQALLFREWCLFFRKQYLDAKKAMEQ